MFKTLFSTFLLAIAVTCGFARSGFKKACNLPAGNGNYSTSKKAIEMPNGNMILIGLTHNNYGGFSFSALTFIDTDVQGNRTWVKEYNEVQYLFLRQMLLRIRMFFMLLLV